MRSSKTALTHKINALLRSCGDSFIITPCTEDEIFKNISEFNNNKATSFNSICLKILKLTKQPISNHLSKFFNPFFSSGIWKI